MAEQQSFPWDFDKPDTLFWRDLDWKMARNFFQAFPPDEQPILECKLEPLSDRSHDDRLRALMDILQERLPAREPEIDGNGTMLRPLKDAEYEVWKHAMLGIASAQYDLGLMDDYEATTRIMLHNGPNGQKNLSAQHGLAWRMVELGRYEEAEDMALEVRDWIDGHPVVGPLSPQALSMWKVLIQTAWKADKISTTQHRIGGARKLVEEMRASKFAKYAEEEGQMLEELIDGLESVSKT